MERKEVEKEINSKPHIFIFRCRDIYLPPQYQNNTTHKYILG